MSPLRIVVAGYVVRGPLGGLVWHHLQYLLGRLAEPGRRAEPAGHTAFFPFGERFGLSGCAIPDDGLPWQPTRQPIVLDAWPVTPPPADGRFTTVLQWDSYKPRRFGNVEFGM